MIVVIAAVVVSVFLHTETDQIARKTPNFLASNWEFLGGNWEKRRLFWIGNGAEYRTLVIGRKGPAYVCETMYVHVWKYQSSPRHHPSRLHYSPHYWLMIRLKKKDCFSGHFFKKQMRQAGFFIIFFIYPKTDEAILFKKILTKLNEISFYYCVFAK